VYQNVVQLEAGRRELPLRTRRRARCTRTYSRPGSTASQPRRTSDHRDPQDDVVLNDMFLFEPPRPYPPAPQAGAGRDSDQVEKTPPARGPSTSAGNAGDLTREAPDQLGT
jgi:hypothetical protein